MDKYREFKNVSKISYDTDISGTSRWASQGEFLYDLIEIQAVKDLRAEVERVRAWNRDLQKSSDLFMGVCEQRDKLNTKLKKQDEILREVIEALDSIKCDSNVNNLSDAQLLKMDRVVAKKTLAKLDAMDSETLEQMRRGGD